MNAIVAKVTTKFPSYREEQARDDLDQIKALSKQHANDNDVITAMTMSSRDSGVLGKTQTRFQVAAEAKDREKQAIKAKAARRTELQDASNFVRQISKYQILSGKTKTELTQKVNEHLKSGWYPYGGVSFAALGMSPVGGNQYIQAIVRFK
jgi:hypothetical protein